MKAVDFVVELTDHYLFVEMKDPQHPRATPSSRTEFVGKLRSGGLDEDLKYKYRDSFLYEWASRRADKPIDYRVLIALNTLDEAQLLTRTEALARSLPQLGPHGRAWPSRDRARVRSLQRRIVEPAIPLASGEPRQRR